MKKESISGELVDIKVSKNVKNFSGFFGLPIRYIRSRMYGQTMASPTNRYELTVMQFNPGTNINERPRRWKVTLLCNQLENLERPDCIRLDHLKIMLKYQSVSVQISGVRKIFTWFHPEYYAEIVNRGGNFICMTVNGQGIETMIN